MDAKKEIKLSNRQLKMIAVMWGASHMYHCGADSFGDDFEQGGDVVEICQENARKMLKDLPLLNTLPDIIDYVSKQK